MALVRNSEEKQELLKNHPRNGFLINLYGHPPWLISLKSPTRTFLNSQNGIMMAQALVKLGMKFHQRIFSSTVLVGRTQSWSDPDKVSIFHPSSAQGSNSDCYLKPVRIFPDPFRCDPHILVLCEVLDSEKNPAATNHRFSCNKTMTKGTGFTYPFWPNPIKFP